MSQPSTDSDAETVPVSSQEQNPTSKSEEAKQSDTPPQRELSESELLDENLESSGANLFSQFRATLKRKNDEISELREELSRLKRKREEVTKEGEDVEKEENEEASKTEEAKTEENN